MTHKSCLWISTSLAFLIRAVAFSYMGYCEIHLSESFFGPSKKSLSYLIFILNHQTPSSSFDLLGSFLLPTSACCGLTSHVNTTSLFVTSPTPEKIDPSKSLPPPICANSSTPPSRTQAFLACEPPLPAQQPLGKKHTVHCHSEHNSESQSSKFPSFCCLKGWNQTIDGWVQADG